MKPGRGETLMGETSIAPDANDALSVLYRYSTGALSVLYLMACWSSYMARSTMAGSTQLLSNLRPQWR